VIDVPGRRAFVAFARRRELSASRACELVKVSRRRLGYVSRKEDKELTMKLKELAPRLTRVTVAGDCGRCSSGTGAG
jgi:hypothetical protein